MSSFLNLRQFTTEQLTLAAAEMFPVFEEVLCRCQEKINEQRRVLNLTRKTQTKTSTTDDLWQHPIEDGQLCNNHENSALGQEEIETPQIIIDEPEPPQTEIKESELLQIIMEESGPQSPQIIVKVLPPSQINVVEPEPPRIKEKQKEPELSWTTLEKPEYPQSIEDQMQQEVDAIVVPVIEENSMNSEDLHSHNIVREFVCKQLTTAAVKIFNMYLQTFGQYQQAIDAQQRLLDITLKPQIKLCKIDERDQRASKEKPVSNQTTNSSASKTPTDESHRSPQSHTEEDGLLGPSNNLKKMEHIIVKRKRKPYSLRVFRQRTSYLGMTEEECRKTFHLSRDVVHVVTGIVAADKHYPEGSCALPVAVKVTVALAFFASGSLQHNVAAVAGVSQKAASLSIHAVASSLVKHANKYITFPSTPERQWQTKEGFMSKYGFPGVLGAIDCTHVPLRAPETEAIAFVNRKGGHSINIQLTCDSSCLVTHVYANFPGSVHDSFILENSSIPGVFQGDPPLDGCLLGDNSFPLKTWLITPYNIPTNRRELAFNNFLNNARSVIERAIVLIKMRFRCLDGWSGTLSYSPQSVSAFFVACCVLHNIATRNGCQFELTEETLQEKRNQEAELEVLYEQEEDQSALKKRDDLSTLLCP